MFKGKEFYGEQKILKGLKGLDFYSFAPKHPGCFKNISKKKLDSDCSEALNKFKAVLCGKNKYDLIVLDEFNIAVRDGFIKVKDVLEVLKGIDSNTNVLITGRSAHKSLLKLADLITDMKDVRHPFHTGILAKRGLEF